MFVCFVIFVCALSGSLVTAPHVMTGEPHEVPVNSTDVLTAARFAVVEFNRANAAKEQFDYTIVNITSAKIQVVAGINYILDMHLARTVCKRNDTDGRPCVIDSDSKELLCHFIVTDIPWEYSRALTRQKCHRAN